MLRTRAGPDVYVGFFTRLIDRSPSIEGKIKPGSVIKWFGADGIGAFCSGQGNDCSVLSTICGRGGKAENMPHSKKDAEQTASWVGAKPILDKILSIW